ncbi:MAG: hypothetical protein Q9227_002999 [Pyrenula ochraceoflavens]
MEERKRPSPYDQQDLAPPSKKQAITANGAFKNERDADMPYQKDIEIVTKDAMSRRIQELKREVHTLSTERDRVKERSLYQDDHFRIIDQWFKQILDELFVLVPTSDASIDGTPPIRSFHGHSDFEADDATFPSSLLFQGEDKIEEHLHGYSDKIQKLITRIYASPSAAPEITSAQTHLTKALAAQKVAQVERDRDRAEKVQLEERLEAAIERYMMAEKKLDRAKSATVAKLERQALLGPQKSGGDADANKKEDIEMNGVIETNDITAKAEIEESNNRLSALSEKQKEQIAALEADKAGLNSQITDLQVKVCMHKRNLYQPTTNVLQASKLSDDDYANTDLFKLLKSQHDDVVKKFNHLEALHAQAQQEIVKFQSERTLFRNGIEAEFQATAGEKDSQLSAAETALTRIRSSRDELMADLAVKKRQLEEDRTSIQRSKELAEACEQRVAALESENTRLKMEPSQDATTLIEADIPAEELPGRYSELKRKYEMLNSELASMQTAYPRMSKLASQKVAELTVREEKLVKLAAEKGKADQKYFAAMKSKESKDGEIKMLKAQNIKSAEVVSSLKESESATKTYSANLEKQLAETKDELTRITSRYRALQQQVTDHTIAMEGVKSQIEELRKVLTSKDSTISSTSTKARQLESQCEELKVSLADTKKSLESWKMKGLGDKSSEYEKLRVRTTSFRVFMSTINML